MYRIKELRENRNLNQVDIAEVINTTQQHYSKIESGKADINGEKLILLAQFYHVSADYILGFIEKPNPLHPWFSVSGKMKNNFGPAYSAVSGHTEKA